MQNDYSELWALVNWCVPDALGTRQDFTHFYAKPMRLGQRIDAHDWEVHKVLRERFGVTRFGLYPQ